MLVDKGPGDRRTGTEPGSAPPQLSAELLSSMAPIDLAVPKEEKEAAGATEEAAKPAGEEGKEEKEKEEEEEDAKLARKVSYGPVEVTLVDGTCECFGTELVRERAYTFVPGESVGLFTCTGCLLRIQGGATTTRLPHSTSHPSANRQKHKHEHACTHTEVAETTRVPECLRLHGELEALRAAAQQSAGARRGPRVVVCGAMDTGKSTLCRMLLNWAVRGGLAGAGPRRRPLFVDTDVGQNGITVPGALAACPVDTVAPVGAAAEAHRAHELLRAAPLCLWFGGISPSENTVLFRFLLDVLAEYCKQKMAADPICLPPPP